MQTITQTDRQTVRHAQFQSALDHLRNQLLLPEEFALRVSNGELQGMLPGDWNQSAGILSCSVFTLGKAELESCLLLLIRDDRAEVKTHILRIIEQRMSPRMVQLIWALTQYFYTLPEMRNAAMLAANSKHCSEEMLKILFSQEQDYIERAVAMIADHNGIISRVIKQYNIILNSPLTNAVLRRYFLKATEQEFIYNQKYCVQILEKDPEDELLPVIVNYLEQPWMDELSKPINVKLYKRFGMPEDRKSNIWQNFSEKQIDRYRQLVYLNMMGDFFGQDSRKYLIFSRFGNNITAIHTYCDKMVMIIDFGQFGIIDTRDMGDHSILLEKATLEMTVEKLERQDQEADTALDNESLSGDDVTIKVPLWTHRKTDIHARDVIIEEKSSDTLVLGMSGLDRLYTVELLTELLRKGEELWPVKFKQAIARFKR